MMKKEMTFPVPAAAHVRHAVSIRPALFAAFKSYCQRCRWVVSLSSRYSRLLETRVTPLQALHLLHVQLAFFLLLLPCPLLLWIRLLLLGWFALAVAQCRRARLR